MDIRLGHVVNRKKDKMYYYNEIKEKLIKSELYDRVKDYSKDRNKVKVYFETGKLLHEAGKEYGKNIIKQYSEKLMIEVGKKYTERNLRYMRQFYEMIENTKWNALRSKLSWTHYREVISIKDNSEIIFYLTEAENKNLTQRKLREIIKNKTFQRLSLETKNKLKFQKDVDISDMIPNPILIQHNKEFDKFSEYILKELILNNLDKFLSQLGYGFSYIGNEYRIKYENIYNYIDLLLFNIDFNCYVVVELKVTELKKEHIGQIHVYMNYIDKNLKKEFQDKTIGIIICKKNNKFVIEYCSDERIAVREYELV